MMAPAAGILAAELILDGGIRSIDGAALSAARLRAWTGLEETTGN